MDRNLVEGHYSTQYTPVKEQERGSMVFFRGKGKCSGSFIRIEMMGCGSEGWGAEGEERTA